MAFDPVSLLIEIAIVIALQIIAYVLTPKPKGPKPDALRDLDNPTAEAGRPIPKLFGTATIKSPNFLWYGEKSSKSYKVKA